MLKRLCLALALSISVPLPGAIAAENSSELLLIQGCRACHVIGPGGGTMGPSLREIGRRLTPQQLRQRIVSPRQLNQQTEMPDYAHLSESEIDLLIQLLQQQ